MAEINVPNMANNIKSIPDIIKNTPRKKIIIISIIAGAVVILIVLIILGFIYFNKLKKSGYNFDLTIFDKINEGATKGVLPSINTNALENKPDVNPVDAANPIKQIKTNPF